MKTCHHFRAVLSLLTAASVFTEPPAYGPATAVHILPESRSDESEYFSLSESLDGAIPVMQVAAYEASNVDEQQPNSP